MSGSNSRWSKGSNVPRYDEYTMTYILNKYREQDGWKNGARVKKRAS